MAQFDVFPGINEPGFLLDIQSDLLEELRTRVVVPLFPPEAGRAFDPRLTPSFDVLDQRVILMMPLLFGIPGHLLRQPVASLAAERDRITRALDTLYGGV